MQPSPTITGYTSRRTQSCTQANVSSSATTPTTATTRLLSPATTQTMLDDATANFSHWVHVEEVAKLLPLPCYHSNHCHYTPTLPCYHSNHCHCITPLPCYHSKDCHYMPALACHHSNYVGQCNCQLQPLGKHQRGRKIALSSLLFSGGICTEMGTHLYCET
jgi:hypothetical protein